MYSVPCVTVQRNGARETPSDKDSPTILVKCHLGCTWKGVSSAKQQKLGTELPGLIGLIGGIGGIVAFQVRVGMYIMYHSPL